MNHRIFWPEQRRKTAQARIYEKRDSNMNTTRFEDENMTMTQPSQVSRTYTYLYW